MMAILQPTPERSWDFNAAKAKVGKLCLTGGFRQVGERDLEM